MATKKTKSAVVKTVKAEPKPLNIVSIIMGGLSLIPLFWFIPVGLVFGVIGLSLHDKRGDKIGFALSLAGTIIGLCSVAIWIAIIVIAAQ